MGQPFLTQVAFAWGTDDTADPNTNTLGVEGTDITGVVKNVKTILHILVKNTDAATGSKNWQLYYNTTDNPATAVQVLTTGSAGTIIVMADGQPTDGDVITARRLSDPTGTWQNGFYTDGDASAKLALAGTNGYTEFQFCILADNSAGDDTDYFFYLRINMAVMDAHTDVPKLTTEAVVGAQDVAPAFIDSAASVGTHAITTTVDVTPNIVPSVAQVFSPTVAQAETQDAEPVLIDSDAQVFTAAITTTVDVAPAVIGSEATVPTHATTVGAADVAPSRIESTVLFPTSAVSAGIDEIESIGAGKDYEDIASWKVAYSDPISDDKHYIGEMYDTADYNEDNVIDDCAGNTDATRHRTLRAATGHEYDPADDTGIWVYSAVADADVFNLAEQYFRLERIGIYYSGTGFQNCVRTVEDEIRVDSCYGFQDLCTSFNRIFAADSSGHSTYWINDIAEGNDGTELSVGPAYGFRSDATSTDMNCYNCLTFNVAQFGGGSVRSDSSFKQVEGSETGDTQNCGGFSELDATSQGEFFITTSGTESHNAATDDTASGTGSLDNQTQADFFTDGDAGDFSLKSGSNGIGAGIDLSGIFTLDFYGNEHGVGPGGWDMGPIAQLAGAGTQDLVPTVIPSAATVPIHAVTTGVVDLVPTRVESTVAIPVHAISTTVDVTPSRIESEVVIPIHAVTVGVVNLTPSRIESTVSIPTPDVAIAGGPQDVGADVVPSAATVPIHAVTTGIVNLTTSRIDSTVSIPTHAVTSTVNITPSRVESVAAVPTHVITTGAVNVSLTILPSQVTVPIHAAAVEGGPQGVTTSRIESTAQVAVVTNLLDDGGMERWTSPTDLTEWVEGISGSSTVNQDGTIKNGGLYSARLDVVAGAGVDANQVVALAAVTRHRFTAYGRTDIDKKIYAYVRDAIAGKNWSPDTQTWNGGVTGVPKSSVGVFSPYIQEFPTVGANNYIFNLRRHSSGAGDNYSGWWDDVSLETVFITTGAVNISPTRIESEATIPIHSLGTVIEPVRIESTVRIPLVTNLLIDGGVEIWTSPTDLTNWTESVVGSSTVNRDGSIKRSGLYAARLDVVAGAGANINQPIALAAATRYRYMVYGRTSGSNLARAFIKDLTASLTWKPSTNSWELGDNGVFKSAEGSFEAYSQEFLSAGAYDYRVYCFRADFVDTYNLWWDDASLSRVAVTTGAVNITPSRIESTAQVFTASVSAGAVNLTPSRIESAVSVPTHAVDATYGLTPSRIDSAVSIAIHSVTVGPVNITATIVVSRAQVFAHTIFAETLTREIVRLTSTISTTVSLTSQIATTVALESDLSLEEI